MMQNDLKFFFDCKKMNFIFTFYNFNSLKNLKKIHNKKMQKSCKLSNRFFVFLIF